MPETPDHQPEHGFLHVRIDASRMQKIAKGIENVQSGKKCNPCPQTFCNYLSGGTPASYPTALVPALCRLVRVTGRVVTLTDRYAPGAVPKALVARNTNSCHFRVLGRQQSVGARPCLCGIWGCAG